MKRSTIIKTGLLAIGILAIFVGVTGFLFWISSPQTPVTTEVVPQILSEKPFYLRGSVWAIGLISFPLIAGPIILWTAYRRIKRKRNSKRGRELPSEEVSEVSIYRRVFTRKWWIENERVALIAFLSLHGVGYFLFVRLSDSWYPNWWTVHVLLDPIVEILIVFLIIFGLMIPGEKKNDKLWSHKLGRIGFNITAGTILIAIFWYIPKGMYERSKKSSAEARLVVRVNPSASNSKPLRTDDFINGNPEGKKIAEAVLDKDIQEKRIIPEQKPFILALWGCESGYRHVGADGKPYHNIERNDLNVIGIGQINVDQWPELKQMGADYDPSTLEGNKNATIWILNTHGGYKWDCYDDVLARGVKEVRVVEAPVNDFGPIVNGRGRGVHCHPLGDVSLQVDGRDLGQHDGPGKSVYLSPKVVSFRYKSDVATPVEVQCTTPGI